MLPKNDKIERKSYVLTPVANAKNITSGGFKKVEVVNNSARQIGTPKYSRNRNNASSRKDEHE